MGWNQGQDPGLHSNEQRELGSRGRSWFVLKGGSRIEVIRQNLESPASKDNCTLASHTFIYFLLFKRLFFSPRWDPSSFHDSIPGPSPGPQPTAQQQRKCALREPEKTNLSLPHSENFLFLENTFTIVWDDELHQD